MGKRNLILKNQNFILKKQFQNKKYIFKKIKKQNTQTFFIKGILEQCSKNSNSKIILET